MVSPTVATFYFYKSFSKPSLGPSLKPSQEPVEPDLALHHGFLEPSPSGTFSGTLLNLTWLCTKASQTFSVAFSGTLLNLTWLCTKASQTFSVAFSGTLLNLTWLCTKASQTLSGTLLNLTWGCTKASQRPELFWAEDPISVRCWGKMFQTTNQNK